MNPNQLISSHPQSMHFSALPITFPPEEQGSIGNIQQNPTHRSIRMTNDDDHSLQKAFSPSKAKNESQQYHGYGIQPARRFFNLDSGNKSNKSNKSNKMIQNNSRVTNKAYQFGDEGVHVAEEVVQRYKASNYVIQRDMLQKFRKDAEQYRRNRNKPKGQERYYPSIGRTQASQMPDRSFAEQRHLQAKRKHEYDMEILRRNRYILEQQEKAQRQMLQERRREELREERRRKKRNNYLKREKENLTNVSNMLRQIDHKIKQNSEQITSSLRSLRKQLKSIPSKQTRYLKLFHSKMTDFPNDPDYELDQMNLNKSACKVPVIMYNESFFNRKADLTSSTIQLSRGEFNESSEDLTNVAKILRKNEQRLKLLSSVRERQSQAIY